MDRQTLLTALLAAAILAGCNRSKSPSPAARAAGHKQETAAPQRATFGGGGQTGDDVAPPRDETTAGPTVSTDRIAALEAARAEAARQAAEKRSTAEMARRKVEVEFQESVVMGALQKPPPDAGQPSTFAEALRGSDVNPLRSEATPQASGSALGNPLRGTAPPTMPRPEMPSVASPPPSAAPPPESTFPPPTPPQVSASRAKPLAPAGPPPTSAPVAPAGPPGDLPAYEVVPVFYGTDRQADESPEGSSWAALSQFVPTGCTLFLSLCIAAFGWSRPRISTWLIAAAGGAISLGLGFQAASEALTIVHQAGKEGPRYTVERSPGGHIERGICEVTIPRLHAAGELEAPDIIHLEVNESAARHVVLQKTGRLADARFYEMLRERVGQSARRELFVFIHGFNVSFEDAARRTAQIHYDLQFDGAPVFFSWPAHDKFIFTYPADETNVAWSVPHLKQFLLEIVKESRAQSIHLIAHSMGSRALAAALREIEMELHEQARLFNQVILAAPDIDADDFRTTIAPAMQRTAQRLTLYASARDDALLASRFLHRGPRAGDAGDGLVVVSGVDTIDVTPIDTSPWGHSYYGSSDPVLHDLHELLCRAIPPRDRIWLSPAERDGLTYWIFQPTRTAGSAESAVR